MVPPDAWVAEHPDDVLDGLDGLVLAGGADIDPGSYGDPRHPKTTNTRPDRDHAEIALALRALERDLPVLGICRGMQLINVALGGTLVQHLPDDVGHTDHRRALGSFDNADHDVRLAPGSLAARACGEIRHATKSHHHQAVDVLGEGVVASGWSVLDDLVEAIELPGVSLGPGRAVAPGGRPALARRARLHRRSRPGPRGSVEEPAPRQRGRRCKLQSTEEEGGQLRPASGPSAPRDVGRAPAVPTSCGVASCTVEVPGYGDSAVIVWSNPSHARPLLATDRARLALPTVDGGRATDVPRPRDTAAPPRPRRATVGAVARRRRTPRALPSCPRPRARAHTPSRATPGRRTEAARTGPVRAPRYIRPRPCPARPPSARPPARCSPPASRRRCSAAGSASSHLS